MDIFVDTSVLVAACVESHPHHIQAFPVLKRVAAKKDKGYMSTHSIAEVFAVLTRLPITPRIHPAEAARIVLHNLLTHFETVAIDERDYREALMLVTNGGWSGAKIYDALLLRCAAKSNVGRIYTFNLTDFKLLAPASLQSRICAPV